MLRTTPFKIIILKWLVLSHWKYKPSSPPFTNIELLEGILLIILLYCLNTHQTPLKLEKLKFIDMKYTATSSTFSWVTLRYDIKKSTRTWFINFHLVTCLYLLFLSCSYALYGTWSLWKTIIKKNMLSLNRGAFMINQISPIIHWKRVMLLSSLIIQTILMVFFQ